MNIRTWIWVLAAAFLAGSCGGGSGATSGDSGSVFQLGTVNRIDTLNPFVLVQPQAVTVADLVYPSLGSYAGHDGATIVGDWASTWQSSDGGRVWHFTLRPGKWSDGQPLTAADAVWTIRTELRYRAGPTALVAAPLAGIRQVS